MDGPYYFTAGAMPADPGPVHLTLSPAGGISTANLHLNVGGTAVSGVAGPMPPTSFAVADWHNQSRDQPLVSLEAITLTVILVIFAILRRLRVGLRPRPRSEPRGSPAHPP